MARPKEFDPHVALTAAMEKFWENGFDATSLVDLTECMGVQKASLYATYGDKRTLFIKALTQYQDHHFEKFQRELEVAASVREYLRNTLLLWMREAATRERARGCFCVNTAVELGPRDPEIAKMLTAHSKRCVDAIAKGLERGKSMGEFRLDLDTQVAARSIYVLVYGVSAAGKGCFTAEELEPVIDREMASLDRRP